MIVKGEYSRFIFFGLPTWALVDGTWAALSQLANTLPEGYNISAYLILALTFGNLSPLLLGFILRDASDVFLRNVINVILVVGLSTGILMSILWNVTVSISSNQVSLPLYILFFTVGACSSSSNVTHYTFVSKFEASDTTALATGMGLGSMIAGLLGILQGLVLINYGFSTNVYYAVLASLYVPSLISFSKLGTSPHSNALLSGNDDETGQLVKDGFHRELQANQYNDKDFLRNNLSILSLQMINSFLGYGIVPAIISYACGKFNNAQLVLLLATAIAAIIDPWTKAATYYFRLQSISKLWMATSVLICLSCGLILCAALPNNSAIYGGNGGVVPVILYVTFAASFGFTNTCVFRYYKDVTDHEHVHHAYRWSGVASQTGAMLGSVIAFCLVVTASL
jgi:MFS family permease